MDGLGFDAVEAGLRFTRARAAVLADDAANARTPGFVAQDLVAVPGGSGKAAFTAVLREAGARGAVGVLEFAMAAQAHNSVSYKALADQERSMLHELRMVAEEARR